MAITFNQIPVNLRVPGVYTEYDSSRAVSGPGIQPFIGLLLGHKSDTGTASNDGTANEDVLYEVTSTAHAAALFGAGSLIHRQAIAWFANSLAVPVWAMAVAGGASDTAAAEILTMVCTEDTISSAMLYIAGEKVTASANGADVIATATDLASNFATAVNENTNLPVTALSSGAQLTLTCKFKGIVGNEIDLRQTYFREDAQAEGVSMALQASPTGRLKGGTGVPDYTDVFGNIIDQHFNVWVWPWVTTEAIRALDTQLAERAGPLIQSDAMAFGSLHDSNTNPVAFNDVLNSPYVTILVPPGSRTNDAMGYGMASSAFEFAAAYAATAAASLSIDPARPLQTLPLNGVKPDPTSRWSWTQSNNLLHEGLSTTYVGANGEVRIQRAITMYTENVFGAEDTAYLDVNTMYTLAYVRWSVRRRLLIKYPRSKLASDGTRFGSGQAIVTPKIIKAEILSLFGEWENIGLVEGVEQFKNDLIVERNANDLGRVDVRMPPDLVNQLRVIAIQIQFII